MQKKLFYPLIFVGILMCTILLTLTIVNYSSQYIFKRLSYNLSDNALLQSSLIQSVTEFDRIYSSNDYGAVLQMIMERGLKKRHCFR